MHRWTVASVAALAAMLVGSGSANSQLTYSEWYPADPMVNAGIHPTCTIILQGCPERWLWVPNGDMVTCAAGLSGYRAPRWPSGNEYFCCAGTGRWRYIHSGGITIDIQVGCP